MTTQASSSRTLLEAVVASLRARARYNRNEQVAPAVILWPDEERQWEPLLPLLRARLPALLTLGDYDPKTRTGPAIWVRCMLARTLKEANWEKGEVPVLYLPGISRQELRAVESCFPSLQPLAELQYRGEFWHQLNGKDWTIYAFLKSKDGGMGLDVARDTQTQEALRQALKDLDRLAQDEAVQKIQELEEEHSSRRQWVWAQLSQAPLARAMAPLSRLASLCATIPGFSSLEEVARFYTETGWQADQENGWQVLGDGEEGEPEGRAWTECGALDHSGHSEGWKLAWRVEEELDGLADRVAALLEAGWRQVRVQTDHGWLLYPGGLPKQEMPAYLTRSRWSRCARLKDQSRYEGPIETWHWCDEVRVAFPRGIRAFYAGEEVGGE